MEKYATQRLIGSVWTLVYELVSENQIKILAYDRKNDIGYEQEEKLDRCSLIEDDKRTVTAVRIGPYKSLKTWAEATDKQYEVVNPQYVFSYSS